MIKYKLPKTPKGTPSEKKASLRHAGFSFLKTGAIPFDKRHIERWVDMVIEEYVSDLGGKENLTTGQALILKEIRNLSIFKILVEEHVAEIGLFQNPEGQLHPAMNVFYLSCSNSLQRACERIGLKRVDKGSLVLQDYIRQHDEKKAKETSASRKANAQEAPGATIFESFDQQDGKEGESPAAPGAPSPRVAGESDPDKKMED